MNSDRTLDQRFNLNNYRHPSQRRQSSSIAISQQAQQQIALPVSPTILRPVVQGGVPISPIINSSENAVRPPGILNNVEQNAAELQQAFSRIPRHASVASMSGASASTTTGTSPVFASSAYDEWFRAMVLSGSTRSAPVTAQASPPPPPAASAHTSLPPATSESVLRTAPFVTPNHPMPTSPVAPSSNAITKILENMDSLAARQDSIFNIIRQALQTCTADSAELKARSDRIDTRHTSIAESIIATTKAIGVFTERIDGLTRDVTAVRNVLGVPPHSNGPEMTDAAKYIRQERTRDHNLTTGGSPNHAINVDEIDEADRGRTVTRSIIDRLDSIEADFAEFMERVRDPDADVDQLRGHSSCIRQRSMRDVGTSLRTPSPTIVQASPEQNESPQLVFKHENFADISPKASSPLTTASDSASDITDTPPGLQSLRRISNSTMSDPVAESNRSLSDKDIFETDSELETLPTEHKPTHNYPLRQRNQSYKMFFPSENWLDSMTLPTEPKPTHDYPIYRRTPSSELLSPSENPFEAELRGRPFKQLKRPKKWPAMDAAIASNDSRNSASSNRALIQHTVHAASPSQKSKSKSGTPETSGGEGSKKTVWLSKLSPSASSEVKVGPPRKRKPSSLSPSKLSSSATRKGQRRMRIKSSTPLMPLGDDSPPMGDSPPMDSPPVGDSSPPTKKVKRSRPSEDEEQVFHVQPRKSNGLNQGRHSKQRAVENRSISKLKQQDHISHRRLPSSAALREVRKSAMDSVL